jgi:SAM-dependent methyltransferase
MTTPIRYVHGYTVEETRRLGEQADVLAELLHGGIGYPPGSRVLEIGCGVGAQTVHLINRNPGADIVAVDISAESLSLASARVVARHPNASVRWWRADARALPFPAASFDHVFVCFLLEHLPDPLAALRELRRVLRPDGTVTVIEGDHESALFHPRSRQARAVIECLVTLQERDGGDALIGRRLHPLLTSAGYRSISVMPRTVYADRAVPELVHGFIEDTFIAMVESVRRRAITSGLVTSSEWDRGIEDLRRTKRDDGTFHYVFFRATAIR